MSEGIKVFNDPTIDGLRQYVDYMSSKSALPSCVKNEGQMFASLLAFNSMGISAGEGLCALFAGSAKNWTFDQVMMVLQSGNDLKLSPMQAVSGMMPIKGTCSAWGSTAAMLVVRSGYQIVRGEISSKSATVTIKGKNGEHTEIYSMDMAKVAGLDQRDTWKKHPMDMLRWKALGRAIKFYCPEVLGGVYIFEDVREDIGYSEHSSAVSGFDNPNPDAEHVDIVSDFSDVKPLDNTNPLLIPDTTEDRGEMEIASETELEKSDPELETPTQEPLPIEESTTGSDTDVATTPPEEKNVDDIINSGLNY